MPERFEWNVFSAETSKLMKDAFEEAWLRVALVEGNRELTRKLLASAIIDLVNEGVMDCEKIVDGALSVIELTRNANRVTRGNLSRLTVLSQQSGSSTGNGDGPPI